MKRFLAALAILGLGLADANGQCYRRSYSYSYPVVEKVIEKVVQPIYQLQYFQVPLYSVAYTPAQYSSTFTSSYQTVAQAAQLYATPLAQAAYAPVVHQSCEEKVATLKLRLEQIEQRLLTAASPPPATAATRPADPGVYQQPEAVPQGALSLATGGHLGVLTAKCASCHEANVAANKGGNFLMFQGKDLIAKDPESKARIAASVSLGEMPKGGAKLTDQEFAAIMQWVKQPSANGTNGHTNGKPVNGHPPAPAEAPAEAPPPPPANGK